MQTRVSNNKYHKFPPGQTFIKEPEALSPQKTNPMLNHCTPHVTMRKCSHHQIKERGEGQNNKIQCHFLCPFFSLLPNSINSGSNITQDFISEPMWQINLLNPICENNA